MCGSCAHFRFGVPAVARNGARASCASWCAGKRGLCVQQWFRLSHECTRLSFERRALCYALIYQHWWAQPLPLIVPYALVVGELCHKSVQDEWQGETGSRVKLYGGRAPPCARLAATKVHGIVAMHACTGDGGFRSGASVAGDAAVRPQMRLRVQSSQHRARAGGVAKSPQCVKPRQLNVGTGGRAI